MLLLATMVAGPTQAQTEPDVPGRAEFRDDGADCFEHEGAGSAACTVLYLHLEPGVPVDVIDSAWAMNVQYPADCESTNRPFAAAPNSEATRPAQVWFAPFPSFISWQPADDGCDGAYHPPKRGIAADISLQPSLPIFVYWYLSSEAGSDGVIGTAPGAMPCVTVRAQLRSMESSGRMGWDTVVGDDVLAEGTATRTILTSPDREQVDQEDPCAEGPLVRDRYPNLETGPVHEFPLLLAPTPSAITRDEGFVLVVEWWQTGTDATTHASQRDWVVHADAHTRPRLVLPMKDISVVDGIEIDQRGNLVTINATFLTPLGLYDVDPASIRLELHDEKGPLTISRLSEPILRFAMAHDYDFSPALVTWSWNVSGDAPDGDVTASVTAWNWQHSANDTETETFLFQPASSRVSPLGILATVAVVAAAVLMAARRR